ncbi:adenylate/guanylate cyclase domain-containing protein [Candidatus Magnetomonas plexicatena]|uniref:adenylate/guanylate cyclase domain-containing protein n=1 Tax=Candidatus Magnetomonas plexicatena TaxID=2552947 RepID=UPI0011046A3B|nr:hypothetical protein E2O03_003015 [Nitrospirales bacterium LBB_01]
MFADIIGSVEFADTLPPEIYKKMLNNYQEIAQTVVKGKDYFRISGDELLFIKKCVKSKSSVLGGKELSETISIARNLKLKWLASNYNKIRLKERKRPIDLAIGINFGYIWSHELNASNISYEGYSISLAKRIESTAREHGHQTRIMLSGSAYQKAIEKDIKVQFSKGERLKLKGMSQDEFVYEILSFYEWIYWSRNDYSVKKDKRKQDIMHEKLFLKDYSNSWLGVKVATDNFLNDNIDKAIDIIEKVIWINKDISVAWIILGHSYIQKAFKHSCPFDKTDIKGLYLTCELLLHQAEQIMLQAIKLDTYNEEVYAETGLLYYFWSNFIDNWLLYHVDIGETFDKLVDKSNDLRKKAYAEFHKGTSFGASKARAKYWLSIMNIEETKPNQLNITFLLHLLLGKKLENKRENQSVMVKKTIDEYLGLSLVPHYKANVLLCAATLLNEYSFASEEDTTLKKLSFKYLDEAINVANKKVPKTGVIFATSYATPERLPKLAFIERCKDTIDKVKNGDSLIERRAVKIERLRRLSQQSVHTLEGLVSGITADNQHKELDFGRPVGNKH